MSTRRLRIEGELGIYRAAELKQALLDALRDTPALEVDLSGVSEMDTCGVQLLMLAKGWADAQGVAFRLAGHSPAVAEVFELMDLAGHFGDARPGAPAML